MKKTIIVTLTLLMCINLGLKAWTLVAPHGIGIYNGISAAYSYDACAGVSTSETELRPNYTAPPTYYECDGLNQNTIVRFCPAPLLFSPSYQWCTNYMGLDINEYPGFPWYDFLAGNPEYQ